MSDIRGKGYGDVHDWRAEPQLYGQRWTGYTCKKCGAHFMHLYREVPNIFKAMERDNVENTCP